MVEPISRCRMRIVSITVTEDGLVAATLRRDHADDADLEPPVMRLNGGFESVVSFPPPAPYGALKVGGHYNLDLTPAD